MAKETAAEKAARISASSRTAKPAATEAAASTSMRGVRVKPVRTTLDMAPTLHGDLADWVTATGRATDNRRLTQADVLRALVRRLLADEELQRVVTEEVGRRS